MKRIVAFGILGSVVSVTALATASVAHGTAVARRADESVRMCTELHMPLASSSAQVTEGGKLYWRTYLQTAPDDYTEIFRGDSVALTSLLNSAQQVPEETANAAHEVVDSCAAAFLPSLSPIDRAALQGMALIAPVIMAVLPEPDVG